MPQSIQKTTYSCLQKGEPMRKLAAHHPSPYRNLTTTHDSKNRKVRSDIKGKISSGMVNNAIRPAVSSPNEKNQRNQARSLRKKQHHYQWYHHQSVSFTKGNLCKWEACPGRRRTHTKKRNVPHETHMRCKDCSIKEGVNMFLCNTTVKGVQRHCHFRYHMKYFKNRKQKIDDPSLTNSTP